MRYSVFTKFWRGPVDEWAGGVVGQGFDGVELPVRDGYAVSPAHPERLIDAVRTLAGHGLACVAVAPPFGWDVDPALVDACGLAGVRSVRVCASYRAGEGLSDAIDRFRRDLDRWLPRLEDARVAVAVQNHVGLNLNGALAMHSVVRDYDAEAVCVALDPAHLTLGGEPFEVTFGLLRPWVRIVNLKNGHLHRSATGTWGERWVGAAEGPTDWPAVASTLIDTGWEGEVCLSGQYTDVPNTPSLAAADLERARAWFARDFVRDATAGEYPRQGSNL